MDINQEKIKQELPPGFVYEKQPPEGFVYESSVPPSFLNRLDRAVVEGLRGPFEGIASLATGATGWVAGKAGGLARLLYEITPSVQLMKGGDLKNVWQKAQETEKGVQQAVSTLGGLYQPTTETGKAIAKGASYPFELGHKGLEWGIEKITDDPEKQAALEFIGDTLMGVLIGKGLHGAAGIVKGKAARGKPATIREIKDMAKERPEIVEALKELPDEMPVKPAAPKAPKGNKIGDQFTRGDRTYTIEKITKDELGETYWFKDGPTLRESELKEMQFRKVAKEPLPEPKLGDKRVLEWEEQQLEKAELGVGKKGYELTPEETTALGLDKPKPLSEKAGEAVVSELSQAMRELKPLRKEQEASYTKERGQRITEFEKLSKEGGEAGAKKAMGALKGEYYKVQTDAYESIRPKFSQEKIDYLFQRVQDSPVLGTWDKPSAIKGLMKIFGEETLSTEVKQGMLRNIKALQKRIQATTDPKLIAKYKKSIDVLADKIYQQTQLPQAKELEILGREFGSEFVKSVQGNWTKWEVFKKHFWDAANIPRSMMASYDLSAPFRQGLFFVGRRQFYSSFKEMFKYFGKEKAYQGLKDSIVAHPNYKYARGRLDLTEMGRLARREEAFQSTLAEKIPGIRQSSRAHTGFLNKLRFDVFNDLLAKAEKLGLDPKNNPKFMDSMADYINAATGRGKLPKSLENAAVQLNALFFSPRLISSRLRLMDPRTYAKFKTPQNKFMRHQAMRDALTLVSAGMTTLQLAKLAGAEVGTDPSSAKFGKITIGNTHFDIWGGFIQYATLLGRLLTAKETSSTTGKVKKYWEGYNAPDPTTSIWKTTKYKFSPIASWIYEFAKGEDEAGNPFKLGEDTLERLVPMVMQDIWDVAHDDPSLIPATALTAAFGVGAQTYKEKKKLIR